MLVKYFGLFFDEEAKTWSPRNEFLLNGLFRFTQPKYLNDQGSEAKCIPYFNEFSPADIAWAEKEYTKLNSVTNGGTPSKDMLINIFLKPMGVRYGECFPNLVKQQTDFKNIYEYDEVTFLALVEELHNILIETLSAQLGVFSLAKSERNELMWTHYASEGKGLAISFNEHHSFFKSVSLSDVSYDPAKRATFTYYKGSLRLNGSPLDNFHIDNIEKPSSLYNHLLLKKDMLFDLVQKLLFSKAEKWSYEDESRIVLPLDFCEEKKGNLIKVPVTDTIPIALSKHFKDYAEINLKKIPFDAFNSVFLGHNINSLDKENTISLIKSNPHLSHVKIMQMRHNIYGELDPHELFV